MSKKLDKIFNESKRMLIDNNTKIVIMSDCHRGAGDNLDNFIKNQSIYEASLRYYYNNNFTYIELGDGDEMWEVKNYNDIVEVNLDIFKQLKKFYDLNRLIMIYGNHDISKKSSTVLEKYFYKYYDKETKQNMPLLDGLTVYESLVLNYQDYDIFLIHGHQVDFLNSNLWRLSRFLVRHVWRTFEQFIVKDPTDAAKNYQVTKKKEKKLREWSIKNNKILIAGHTHRAIFPKVGQSLYFNDGSCIHPNGITCLEIENGNIALVKWVFNVNKDEVVSIKRKVLEKKEPIINFFK
ncbi:MAG: metallophosphoesterase family protein [Bacilli bacterium]|nr:metallophosphoesterase family protein [Bacilli bacterium]